MITILVAVLWWWGMAAAACGLGVFVLLVAFGVRDRRERRRQEVSMRTFEAEVAQLLAGRDGVRS